MPGHNTGALTRPLMYGVSDDLLGQNLRNSKFERHLVVNLLCLSSRERLLQVNRDNMENGRDFG